MTKFGRDECHCDEFSSSVGWPENGVGDLANCILIALFSMRMQYDDKVEETIAVAGTGDAPDVKVHSFTVLAIVFSSTACD